MSQKIMTLLLSTCFMAQSFAANLEVQVPNLPILEESMKAKALGLINRHKGNDLRPEACPLESKKHIDILSKITTIKTLLKDNCLESDQNRIDEILSGAKSIQAELDKVSSSVATATNDPNAVPNLGAANMSVGGTQIDGQQITQVVSGINTLFKSRSCKSLQNNQSLLEETANVISDFASVGLLVPNTYTLAVAGGGLALSTILTVLNTLLQRRFDFQNTQDRQAFIKLNCAFYDVRRDIERAGLMDVATDDHRADQVELQNTAKELESFWQGLLKVDESIMTALNGAREEHAKQQLAGIYDLVDLLPAMEQVSLLELKDNEKKLTFIKTVADLYLKNPNAFRSYKEQNISGVPLMDEMMLNLLQRFNHIENPAGFMALTEMKTEQVVQEIQAPLLFHSKRLLKEVLAAREKSYSHYYDSAVVNDLPYKEYIKLRTDEIKKAQESYLNALVGLQNSSKRVDRILSDDGVSSRDDGSENMVSILQGHAEIAAQIYGKYGDKFMQYNTETSRKENKHFVRKFKKFARDYLILKKQNGETVLAVKAPAQMGEFNIKLACQDARPYRAKWKFSEALAQQGYDFVATNGDLFHSDFRRPFLGRTGDRVGIHEFKNRFERIQAHYRSAIYAKKFMNGDNLSDDIKDTYFKKKLLGRSLIDLRESKKSSELLQELIEKYNCMANTALE